MRLLEPAGPGQRTRRDEESDAGEETAKGRKRYMRTGGALRECEGSGCCGNGESGWSDPVPIFTEVEG